MIHNKFRQAYSGSIFAGSLATPRPGVMTKDSFSSLAGGCSLLRFGRKGAEIKLALRAQTKFLLYPFSSFALRTLCSQCSLQILTAYIEPHFVDNYTFWRRTSIHYYSRLFRWALTLLRSSRVSTSKQSYLVFTILIRWPFSRARSCSNFSVFSRGVGAILANFRRKDFR